LRKLRRSNYILEKILSEQRVREVRLEGNCRVLEETLKRNKNQKLKQTVRNISGNLFLMMVAALLYGNWTMFGPHLDAIVMAVLVFALVHDHQAAFIHTVDHRLKPVVSLSVLGSTASCCAAVPFVLHADMVWLVELPFVCALLSLLLVKFASSKMVTAMVLTLGIVGTAVFVLAVILKSCVAEAEKARSLLFDTVLDDLSLASRLNSALQGYLVLESSEVANTQAWLKTNLVDLVVSTQSAIGVVTNVSNLTWACGTFGATLFSLLQTDVFDSASSVSAFSPFSLEDNMEIYRTLRTGTLEVFVQSMSIGVANGVITYASLWWVSSPLVVLPAVASSVLAAVPLFGSYLALSPFVVGFYLAQLKTQALFLAVVYLIMLVVVNPLLVSSASQGGSSKFLGGLPIVAGLYAFGLGGIVFGPLIVGLTGLFAKIYSRALNHPDSDDEEDGDESIFNQSAFGFDASSDAGRV
jgi:predicted PurR-regulated permease PerM